MNNYARFRNDEELLWVGIDLDNTLAKGIWPEQGIGEAIDDIRNDLEKLITVGLKPVLYTSRHWNDYENISRWIKDNDLPIHKIICGKPLFYRTIDDRNLEGSLKECVMKILGSKL